jgi:hypothetical protein
MVSAEGACAAYYAYGRHLEQHKVAAQIVSVESLAGAV